MINGHTIIIDNNIQITVLTDQQAVAALKSSIPSKTPPPAPMQQASQNEHNPIPGYIARYINKDASVLPLMVELLKQGDFKLRKRLLYAINNIKYTTDWNFRITEPVLIETLFSLTKYRSLESPLLDVLLTYRMEGYIGTLEKLFAATNSRILSALLYHLTHIGRFDCLRMLEKKVAGRHHDKLMWPMLLMTLKSIGARCDKATVPYLEAIIMHLFKRGTIPLKDLQKGSMREDKMNYMHLLCLYGTEKVTPLIDEITPFLSKDYLAYFRYRMGITTDLTEILDALRKHDYPPAYRQFILPVGLSNMTEEWKVAIMLHSLENKTVENKLWHAMSLSQMFDWLGDPNFIKEHISLVKDPEVANALLKLHTIKNLPVEPILSDFLNAGLLGNIQTERAFDKISFGRRAAPHALPGYVLEGLYTKFIHDAYYMESTAVFMQHHIEKWAKDCGAPIDGLTAYAASNQENDDCSMVKAVLSDKGYIMTDLSGNGLPYNLEPVRALLNTILEYENIPGRIVPMLQYFSECHVLGNVEKLQALNEKYDFEKSVN
ncbi:hypothetical protein F0L74_09320 [Chitinophaga agrisoli]|uniref:Uncharacterized protein n=1 Tax=Chitinophaga agrisoli TaxID=2607653 RepID=A0A5B2VWU1_9BACT|nr:hypothetical protein [Chitinophaga agrisoli]KAA2242717.1 hypothetical protein F0L74_09320 [Chitinophaga agrisoli]